VVTDIVARTRWEDNPALSKVVTEADERGGEPAKARALTNTPAPEENYATRTFSPRGPFGPCPFSNVTA
jgi:hypothetical protein